MSILKFLILIFFSFFFFLGARWLGGVVCFVSALSPFHNKLHESIFVKQVATFLLLG